MNNNREDQRVGCFVAVDAKENHFFSGTNTVDFSQGGMGLISKNSVPLNSRIAIEIELGKENNSVLVFGEVKWVHQMANSDNYRIGLSFESIERRSKSRLNQYFQDKEEVKNSC